MPDSRTSILQIAVLLVATFIATIGRAQENADVPSVAVASEPAWFRQLAQLSVEPGSDAEISIAVDGVASVYLNGQRLAKDVDVNQSTVSWKIGSLLRKGRNSVAVAVDCDKPGSLGVWFSGSDVPQLRPQNWKSTAAAPPVGWQKTDFNDRDWKPAAQADAFSAGSLAKRNLKPLQWAVDNGAARVKNGVLHFHDGDHVLMLGGTFIERAQSFGYLESAISCSTPGHVTFRNLGWSADTVFAESRGIFDSPAKGYERLIEHVRAEEPNVVLLCYGQNEAMGFAGDDAGRQRYGQQLTVLCTDIQTTGAEVVLMSPHPFLDIKAPFPNPAKWNSSLAAICTETKSVADSLELLYVDLFSSFVEEAQDTEPDEVGMALVSRLPDHPGIVQLQHRHWSDNGMHWNADGYSRIAQVVRNRLTGTPAEAGAVNVNLKTQRVTADKASIRNVKPLEDGRGIQFEFQSASVATSPSRLLVIPRAPDSRVVAVVDFDGRPNLNVDLIAVEQESAESLLGFLNLDFESVRRLTTRKNELYFHRWRPQNITYLYGFRKHEQGNNASEIAQFDPLIAELEQKIDHAKQPQWYRINIQETRDNQ